MAPAALVGLTAARAVTVAEREKVAVLKVVRNRIHLTRHNFLCLMQGPHKAWSNQV